MEFIDLKSQRARLGRRIDDALARVLEHGRYIMGPEVTELEAKLAAFAGTKYCVSCASGTDALSIPLMAWGIKPGDAVFVPAFTFAATAEVVALQHATPIFIDVLPGSFNIDPKSLVAGIGAAKELGLRPRGMIPVDLFGQPADYVSLQAIAEEHGLMMLADAAQSFGASLNNRRVGSYGHVASTSFFPAKPLGCYGDGGAIFTDDAEMVELMTSIRVHGQGRDKYENVRLGLTSRLDTIQAAILLQKLEIFEDEIEARGRVAQRYNEGLKDLVQVPLLDPGATSVWAQYTMVIERRPRDAVAADLKEAGIPTATYYPIPLNLQPGYSHFPSAPGGMPVSEAMAKKVLSLPMHPYLDEATQDRIIEATRTALR